MLLGKTSSHNNALQRYVPFFIFLIGYWGIILPYLVHGTLVGDVGDGRFNRYVLEHFYLALQGKANFLDAPFFYPWVQTISFSDNHWGSGLIYVLFRIFNFSSEKAYELWFCIAFVLNYWVAYWVGRSFELSRVSSAIAAFFFTFALPVLQQDGHPQLAYRFYVPLAFWTWHHFLRAKDPCMAALTALLIALQLLISLYIGVFLIYFLVAYAIAERFFARLELNSAKVYYPKKHGWLLAAGIFGLSFAVLLLFAIPYLKAQHIYGFHRSWNEIRGLLPTFQSLFIADNSNFWFKNIFTELSVRHEKAWFIGVGAFLLFLYAIFSKKFLTEHPLSYRLLVTIILLTGFTFLIGEFSLYRIVAYLPGFSAVRAVGRIIVVLVFPMSIIIGQVLDTLFENKESHWLNTSSIAILLVIAMCVDSVMSSKHISSEKEWQGRMLAFAKKINQPINKDSVIILKSNSNEENIDAMMFSQLNHIKTMNGYSGNQPSNYIYPKNCQDAEQNIQAAERFYHHNLQQSLSIDRNNLIYIGFDENCKTYYQVDNEFISTIEKLLPPSSLVFKWINYYPKGVPQHSKEEDPYIEAYFNPTNVRVGFKRFPLNELKYKNDKQSVRQLLNDLALMDFKGLYIDRRSLQADSLEKRLSSETNLKPTVVSTDKRLVFYDLRDYINTLKKSVSNDEWKNRKDELQTKLVLITQTLKEESHKYSKARV